MNKFFIDYQNGRKYYAYQYQNGQIKYIALNEEHIEALLSKILSENINKLVDHDNYTEIYFDNLSIIIDNLKIFYPEHNSNDKYFLILYDKIKEIEEKERIKKELQSRKIIPRVNRTPKLPTKQIIAGILSFSVGISLIAGSINQETKKKEKEPVITAITYTPPAEETKSVINSPNYTINLSFPNRVETNRVSAEESKLEETINNFSTYISLYSTNYGLPYELCCALITQERPNFKDGVCHNPCQITYKYFVGQTITAPLYDELGFTGNYDTFLVTEDMLNSPEGNIRVGLAYLRNCIDRFDSLVMGTFAYNQGISALNQACNYFDLDKENYLGEENSIKARDLINRYYETLGKSHGDKNYLENVFSYLELENRGSITLSYYLGSNQKTIEINNTLVYNSELSR